MVRNIRYMATIDMAPFLSFLEISVRGLSQWIDLQLKDTMKRET